MTKDEALKLALEALETLMIERGSIYDKAITAIKEALAQPEQKPWAVARVDDLERAGRVRALAMGLGLDVPLYAAPPQRKPLTDEEIETYRYMIDWTAHWSYINFARAIEAAHGIKGEA